MLCLQGKLWSQLGTLNHVDQGKDVLAGQAMAQGKSKAGRVPETLGTPT